MRAEINCENCYETLYLTDSGDANITEDTRSTSSTDDKFCFDKKKRLRKRKELTPRKEYPAPASNSKFDKNMFASHKHINPNSNAISNDENLLQQTRNTFEKIRASYSNIVKQKPKHVVSLQIAC